MGKSRRWVKAGLVLVALLILLPFQNCGKAFEAMNGPLSSTLGGASQSPELLAAQNRAISILSANCKACHQDQALGSISNILNVNYLKSSGLIKPGLPLESPLMMAVSADVMPPAGPLSLEDKSALGNWILMLGGQGPQEPAPSDLSFTLNINTDPLPFRARLGKMGFVVGSINNPSLNSLKSNRGFLGDYDFANGVGPKVSWEPNDMKVWLESMQDTCDSANFKTKYPWPGGVNDFLQNTIGREPSSVEQGVIQEVQALAVSNDEKSAIFCLTMLTSLEFISK